ncbi:DUF3558 family protein [Gordonia bronchialis]|uniref:DUF3558 family protein n=1 Tax=Gordonia bronchialis TaxID=2054 RepID=UPI003C6D3C65
MVRSRFVGYWSAAIQALLILGSVACTAPGEPVSSSSSVEVAESTLVSIRQTDAVGRRLPFATKFPNRWSINNDGSTYEPCTSVNEEILVSLNLDPRTVKDAAVADHQTVRGCIWKYKGERFASADQHVGNMNGGVTSIEGYKARNRDFRWFADSSIDGRTIGVFSVSRDDCGTIVESGRAFVFTDVGVGTASDDVSENCRRALAFTRATIDLIPR